MYTHLYHSHLLSTVLQYRSSALYCTTVQSPDPATACQGGYESVLTNERDLPQATKA